MKLNGLVGGGTGKLGNSVFSQNAGRTIVRQYQSEVKNPNTDRQQNSRARFTLAGDIAKQFAQALAIGRPRVGALTSRNQFTKDIIPVSAGVIRMVGTTLTPDYSKMPIAKGGMPTPVVQNAVYDGGNEVFAVNLVVDYNVTAASYIPPMTGEAGLVMVCHNETTGEVHVEQKAFVPSEGTLQGVQWGPGHVTVGHKWNIYVFAKWIPTSHNDITTTTEPWRYPSDQSDVVFGATVTIPN